MGQLTMRETSGHRSWDPVTQSAIPCSNPELQHLTQCANRIKTLTLTRNPGLEAPASNRVYSSDLAFSGRLIG